MKNKKSFQLTEKKIMNASWELLSSVGIEEFSMRKLADQLDIKAASLYWYFKSKQDLFQALANEVAKEILTSLNQEEDWKEQLYNFAIHMRLQLKKFPCSAQLLMKTLPSEADYLRLVNALLKIVDQLKLSDRDKFSSTVCLLNYVISFEVDKYEQDKINLAMNNEADTGAKELFKQSIACLPDADTNVLQRMHNNHLFKELGSDSMFESGLNILIMGIERLVEVQA